MKILAYETLSNGDPTNNEKLLESSSIRKAAIHIAYTLNGKVSNNKKFVNMSDGKRWHFMMLKKETE